MIKKFKEASFHPDLTLKANFFGGAETSKKNRVKLKIDYIDVHLTSNEFKMKDLQHMLTLLNVFGEEEEEIKEIVENPLFKFIENAEEIQAKLKMASIRSILKLYEIGVS